MVFIRQDELEEYGSHEVDMGTLKSNQYLIESLPDLTDIVRDKADMFIAAAGVAFTDVSL